MKRIILLTFIAVSVHIWAQTNVAVFVTGLEESKVATMKIIGSELVAGLVANGDYNAFERTDDFIKAIQDEQNAGHSPQINDQKIRDFGKQYGASMVCVAKIMPFETSFYIQARMINVKTAAIIATARETSTLESLDEIVVAAESLTTKLSEQLNIAKTEQEKAAELEKEAQRKASQERAIKQLQEQAKREEEQERLQESLEGLGNTIQQIVQSENSYIVEIQNATKNPYRINLDGHILGVVHPYKVQRYKVPTEWYGRMQAVQTSGYVLSPTIKEYRIPRQNRHATARVRIQ